VWLVRVVGHVPESDGIEYPWVVDTHSLSEHLCGARCKNNQWDLRRTEDQKGCMADAHKQRVPESVSRRVGWAVACIASVAGKRASPRDPEAEPSAARGEETARMLSSCPTDRLLSTRAYSNRIA
jgi:hypothetical protein